MGTTIRDPSYTTTEAEAIDNNINVASLHFRPSLKMDCVTGAHMQGSFTECSLTPLASIKSVMKARQYTRCNK